MTFTRIVRQVEVIAAGCCLSIPLSAHVIQLGTVEHTPHELLSNIPVSLSRGGQDAGVTNSVSSGDDASGKSSPAGNAPLPPWDGRAIYTFADVAPEIDGVLAAHTLYRGVLDIAAKPKTETWLAFLIGVSLVAVQLRRTQRLLHHRPMAR